MKQCQDNCLWWQLANRFVQRYRQAHPSSPPDASFQRSARINSLIYAAGERLPFTLHHLLFVFHSPFAFKRHRNCAVGMLEYISSRFSGINSDLEIVCEVFSLPFLAYAVFPRPDAGRMDARVNKSIRLGHFQHVSNMISTSLILPPLQTAVAAVTGGGSEESDASNAGSLLRRAVLL